MGLFDRLFGRKRGPPAHEQEEDEFEDTRPTDSQPIHGSPEFVRAVEIQRAYWTHDPEEQSRLESRRFEQLSWGERLRLHHLFCLQRIKPGPEQRAAAGEKCRQSVRRLIAADSPYRPRPALIWQGQSAEPETERAPDMQGELLNASLTHLGCLEVYRIDAAEQPAGIEFVSFDQLSGVAFAQPSLIRAANLFYDDGRAENVLVPLLYGLTWAIGKEHDRAGRMTRFVAHLDDEELGAILGGGLGVGQHDFLIRDEDGRTNLFGLGSVAEIAFPLDMDDPRFDERARARGMDPDELRARLGGG